MSYGRNRNYTDLDLHVDLPVPGGTYIRQTANSYMDFSSELVLQVSAAYVEPMRFL